MEMQTLREIQENLVNKILVTLAVVTMPVLFFFSLRFIDTGLNSTFYIYIPIYLSIISIALLRKNIFYQIKTFFLTLLFFFLSALSVIFFGMGSFFMPYMMLSILIAGIFMGKKTAILVFSAGTVMFSAIGFLYIKGLISSVVNDSFYKNLTSWLSLLSIFIFIGAVVIITIGEIVYLLAQKISMLEKMNKELIEAGNEIKTLHGILPICAKCKKIRDDNGYWTQVESYIESCSEAKFSHGLCEKCADELYGNEGWYKNSKKK